MTDQFQTSASFHVARKKKDLRLFGQEEERENNVM